MYPELSIKNFSKCITHLN